VKRIHPKDERRFINAWREYENMVTRVLPRFALRQLNDLAEDLDYLLFCRDEIEAVFHQYLNEPKLTTYRTRILALDVDLVLQRGELFARLPLKFYRAARKRNAVPRSQWWWYLDEIKSESRPVERTAAVGTRLPLARESSATYEPRVRKR